MYTSCDWTMHIFNHILVSYVAVVSPDDWLIIGLLRTWSLCITPRRSLLTPQ